jgi:hypothetical protein
MEIRFLIMGEEWRESDWRDIDSKNLFSTDKQIGLPCTLFYDDEYCKSVAIVHRTGQSGAGVEFR